jgi:GNAT superfamily N-acetyltransferase
VLPVYSSLPSKHNADKPYQFEYRLSRCPELSLGLFTRPTEAEAPGKEGDARRRLIAHVVATRSPAPSVTDASMGLPAKWRERKSSLPSPDSREEIQGHQEQGGTVCVHSVAVAKEFQGMGLGTVLMKAYIQRIKDSKCAERMALLAHEHLIKFYIELGFQNMGKSSATFGGGNWHNLVSRTSASR